MSALVGMDLAASGVVLNLCFHGIGAPRRVLEPDEERFWVKESQFDEMLDTVADDPAVRISFDDANASDIATALPKHYGNVDRSSILAARLHELARRFQQLADEQEVRTLVEDDARLRVELERMREDIEAILPLLADSGSPDRR